MLAGLWKQRDWRDSRRINFGTGYTATECQNKPLWRKSEIGRGLTEDQRTASGGGVVGRLLTIIS